MWQGNQRPHGRNTIYMYVFLHSPFSGCVRVRQSLVVSPFRSLYIYLSHFFFLSFFLSLTSLARAISYSLILCCQSHLICSFYTNYCLLLPFQLLLSLSLSLLPLITVPL